MKTKAFRAALPYTLPICVGFLFLGMSYGFFMRSQGFSFVYPLLMSLFIFAGSMEFVTANLLLLPTSQKSQLYSGLYFFRPQSPRKNAHSLLRYFGIRGICITSLPAPGLRICF